MAHYDKSVSMDDLKAAIDERYGKWAVAGPPTMQWRVISEKFVIQLWAENEQPANADDMELGTKTVVYLSIDPAKCGSNKTPAPAPPPTAH